MFQRIKLVTVLFLDLAGTLAASGAGSRTFSRGSRSGAPSDGRPAALAAVANQARAGTLDLAAVAADVAQHVPLFRREVTLIGPPRRATALSPPTAGTC